MAVDPIEQLVERIDAIDAIIDQILQGLLQQPLTIEELDNFKQKLADRERLNFELVTIRVERSRRRVHNDATSHS